MVIANRDIFYRLACKWPTIYLQWPVGYTTRAIAKQPRAARPPAVSLAIINHTVGSAKVRLHTGCHALAGSTGWHSNCLLQRRGYHHRLVGNISPHHRAAAQATNL